jgi:hypothetical protein
MFIHGGFALLNYCQFVQLSTTLLQNIGVLKINSSNDYKD